MSKKIKTLTWPEPNAKKGGKKSTEFGLEVNFKKETIITSEGRELIFKDNLDDVRWVIDNNLTSITEKRDRFQHKLDITEITRLPIKDGYKLLEPLSGDDRDRYSGRVLEMSEEILNIEVLVKKYKKED